MLIVNRIVARYAAGATGYFDTPLQKTYKFQEHAHRRYVPKDTFGAHDHLLDL